jgi:tetratricopeptide (TPR) repeat protein
MTEDSVDFKSSRSLFIIIILGFVMAIFFGTRAHRLPSAPQPAETSGLLFWLSVVLGALCLLLGLLVYVLLRRNFALDAENQKGLALLESGRLDEAEIVFDSLMKKHQGNWIMKNNLAVVAIRQGRFDHASQLLKECSEVKQIPKLPLIPMQLAYLHALNSELDVAEQTYDEALKLTPAEQSGYLAMPNALITVRRGAYKLLAEVPAEEWFAAETGSPCQMRCLRVLRAFALSKMPVTETSQAAQAEMLSGVAHFGRENTIT